MKIRSALLALLATVALGCAKPGTGTATSDASGSGASPVELKVTAEKGEKYTSTAVMDVKMTLPKPESDANLPADQKKMMEGDQTMKVTFTTDSELIEVKDGKYTWVDTITDVKAEATGVMAMATSLAEGLKGMKTTTIMDSRGKILDQKVEGGPTGASGETGAVEGFGFPEKPVKVGDSWESKSKTQGQEVTLKNTLTAMDDATVTLDTEMSGVQGLKPGKHMKVVLDRKSARPISVDANMEMDQQGAEVLMKITVKRK